MHKFLSENRFALLGVITLIAGLTAASYRSDSASETELARLRRHFRTVEAELTSRDVRHLSAEQSAARVRNIEVLRQYAAAGVFPHNHDFAGKRVPYFRDEHGTLCAMAYLIARSGRADLVDRVERNANNAYLPELARDPDLQAWLDANGLTVAEAARIQPTYGWEPESEDQRRYERATVAASVVSGGVITWTLVSDPKRASYAPGLVAMGVGIFDMMLGMSGGLSGARGSLPELNAVVGGVTTLAGIAYTVRRLHARTRPKSPPTTTSTQSQAWQPVLYNDGSGRTHVGLNLRF